MIKIVVFGSFDRVHPGHTHFLEQTKEYGDYLTVIISRDSYIRSFKGREPFENQLKRISNVKKTKLADQVILGDEILGTYKTLERIKPDVICLGYDQIELKQNLEQWILKKKYSFRIEVMIPHKPGIFKTSIINKEEIKSI